MTAQTILRPGLPAHAAHPLHDAGRDWPETNCYVDVWIEILHALGLEPAACLAFTLAVDFEGDQWTFHKPPHGDLTELYGLVVDELTLWRPLVEHVEEQVARGSLPLVEVDSFYLPDTAGSDYRENHVKTTIGVARIDRDLRTLQYFHNRGFHELGGPDFDGILRLDRPAPQDYLPPFAEIVKTGRLVRRPAEELRSLGLGLARRHAARIPAVNPFGAYEERLARDVELLAAGGPRTYHLYSFASIRQFGSAAELASSFLRWLSAGQDPGLDEAAAEFAGISQAGKALILKLARIAHSGRVRDLSPGVRDLAALWERGTGRVAAQLRCDR